MRSAEPVSVAWRRAVAHAVCEGCGRDFVMTSEFVITHGVTVASAFQRYIASFLVPCPHCGVRVSPGWVRVAWFEGEPPVEAGPFELAGARGVFWSEELQYGRGIAGREVALTGALPREECPYCLACPEVPCVLHRKEEDGD